MTIFDHLQSEFSDALEQLQNAISAGEPVEPNVWEQMQSLAGVAVTGLQDIMSSLSATMFGSTFGRQDGSSFTVPAEQREQVLAAIAQARHDLARLNTTQL